MHYKRAVHFSRQIIFTKIINKKIFYFFFLDTNLGQITHISDKWLRGKKTSLSRLVLYLENLSKVELQNYSSCVVSRPTEHWTCHFISKCMMKGHLPLTLINLEQIFIQEYILFFIFFFSFENVIIMHLYHAHLSLHEMKF